MARRAMTDLAWQRRGRAGSGRAPTESRAIRGRERELQAVSELVRGAAKGRGGTLLIEGELGAGKSLLLSRAADAARAAGVSVAVRPPPGVRPLLARGPGRLAPGGIFVPAGGRRVRPGPDGPARRLHPGVAGVTR